MTVVRDILIKAIASIDSGIAEQDRYRQSSLRDAEQNTKRMYALQEEKRELEETMRTLHL
jgi:hypothetical protein